MVATPIISDLDQEIERIELAPRSTYEVVTRERLDNVVRELRDVRARIDTIFYLIIGSILLQVLLGFVS